MEGSRCFLYAFVPAAYCGIKYRLRCLKREKYNAFLFQWHSQNCRHAKFNVCGRKIKKFLSKFCKLQSFKPRAHTIRVILLSRVFLKTKLSPSSSSKFFYHKFSRQKKKEKLWRRKKFSTEEKTSIHLRGEKFTNAICFFIDSPNFPHVPSQNYKRC